MVVIGNSCHINCLAERLTSFSAQPFQHERHQRRVQTESEVTSNHQIETPMAAPFRIKESELPLPHKRAGHVAVTWNKATIIWGGQSPEETITNSEVLLHLSGKWVRKETTGDVPTDIRDTRAHVVNDNMFVFAPNLDSPKEILYSLDLNSWIWSELAPRGHPPTLRKRTSSWVHNGRIYTMGGMTLIHPVYHPVLPSQQLFCYNICKNSWEWPSHGGDIPGSRFNHSTVISGKTVFLFGGFRGYSADGLNDLHILDMESMVWKRVHHCIPKARTKVPCPSPMRYTSQMHKKPFTRISPSMALLFSDDILTTTHDLWLLNLDKAKELIDEHTPTYGPKLASTIWTKISLRLPRDGYAIVLEPKSRNLWVMGGRVGTPSIFPYPNYIETSDVLVMPLNPSLQDLAVASVARHTCPQDPRLAPDQLSSDLRGEIEAYRSEIGGEYLCSQEERCSRCMPLWD